MMTITLTPSKFIIILFILSAVVIQAQEDSATSNQTTSLYERVDFIIKIEASLYENPFDENDIALNGIFTSPAGEIYTIPGFWSQTYENTCTQPCVVEDLERTGDPLWQIRFTPNEPGAWIYTFEIIDDGTVIQEETGNFSVEDSDKPGFIHLAENNRYFQHDDGTAYFPLGSNLNWSWDEGGGIIAYRQWLRDLRAAGGNYARLYIDVPWFIHLEWEGPAGDYSAAQDEATKLDLILNTAEQEGIKLQLVLLWQQTVNYYNTPPVNIPTTPPRPIITSDWDNHPYNFNNGGPLSGPSLFLTDERAHELFKRRLRYIVGRWGYSPAIFAWELVDEIDSVFNYEQAAGNFWLSTMGEYLRLIDPYRHLITFGINTYNPVLANLPVIDFTQSSVYQRLPIESGANQVVSIEQSIVEQRQTRQVPVFINAFSLNSWYEPLDSDPDGVHFQNTLWASVLSGSAGAAASDWGGTYIIPQHLTRYYRPIANFTADINWAATNLQPAVSGLGWSAEGDYAPLRIDGFMRQFLVNTRNAAPQLTITSDGAFSTLDTVPSYLYGKVFNSQLNAPQTYHVAVPIDTFLEIGIRSVSNDVNARLLVMIDGQVDTEIDLRPGSRNTVIRTALSAGEHTIVLDNIGDDWLELDYIEISDLVVPARALTLRDTSAGMALVWIRHRDYTWNNVAAGNTLDTLQLRYQLDNMPQGVYKIDIWNPFSGAVIGEVEQTVSSDGRLWVDLPPLNDQIALRIFRDAAQSGTLAPTPTDTPTPQPLATDTPAQIPTATPTPTRTPFRIITNTPRANATTTPNSPNQ